MDRRKFLVGVGSASVGGSALLGSGAFTSVESHRTASIAVANDSDAYLGLDKCDSPNGSYVHDDGAGHVQILMDETNPHHPEDDLGAGVNSNSITRFHDTLQICNQGKQSACLWLETNPVENGDGDDAVIFYEEGDEDARIEGEDNAFSLDVGECTCIGLSTRTFGLSEGDSLLDPVDDSGWELVFHADANADCGPEQGGGPSRTTWSLDPDEDPESGGPVVLMGIDKEDGGPGGHGPISTYVDIVNDILSRVGNNESGILVIGGDSSSNVTAFWDEISSQTGEPVTYVRGATDIQNQDFSGFAMLGIVDSSPETFGGMSQAENDALVARSDDVATFVNQGGGLLGGTQTDFSNAWAYISDIGDFSTNTGQSISDVTPTSAGNDIGIHDPDLDICCWHDTFTDWPDFLDVLAWEAGEEDLEAVALGGESVSLPVEIGITVTGLSGMDVGDTESYDLRVTNDGDELTEEDVHIEVVDGTLVASPGSFTLTAGYDNTWMDGIEISCSSAGQKVATVKIVGDDTDDTYAELDVDVDCL